MHARALRLRLQPTPYAWPDVNSHFGILDLCGFEKDRTYWYKAWFPAINEPVTTKTVIHSFPHWNWKTGDKVDIWTYSNAAFIELFVNGASLGRQAMPQFGHVQWLQVPFVAGSYHTVAYDAENKTLGTANRSTTGAPAALRASIRDNVGAIMYAGCNDYGLVMVEVVDAAGLVVPDAANIVSLALRGSKSAFIDGTGNGDPAGHFNNKLPVRPAYHGLMLGVISGGDDLGTLTVTATSPGLASATVTMEVAARDDTVSDRWCSPNPKW